MLDHSCHCLLLGSKSLHSREYVKYKSMTLFTLHSCSKSPRLYPRTELGVPNRDPLGSLILTLRIFVKFRILARSGFTKLCNFFKKNKTFCSRKWTSISRQHGSHF